MARERDYWIHQGGKPADPWAIHVFASRQGRAKWYTCNVEFYADWLQNGSKRACAENVKICMTDMHHFTDLVKLLCDSHGMPFDNSDKNHIEEELTFLMVNF